MPALSNCGWWKRGWLPSLRQMSLRTCGYRVELLAQLDHLSAQVLLARAEPVQRQMIGDAASCQEVEHLSRAEPFTHVERGLRPAASPLDLRELDIDAPFIGLERGAVLFEHQSSGDALELSNRRP